MKNGEITDVDINEGLDMEKTIPQHLLNLVDKLTI